MRRKEYREGDEFARREERNAEEMKLKDEIVKGNTVNSTRDEKSHRQLNSLK